MKVSKVVLIVVALHVLVIGGIFIFEGCSRAKTGAPELAANETTPTDPTGPATVVPPDPTAMVPALAPVQPIASVPAPAPAPVVSRSYVVKKGDTLSKIARAERVSMAELASANNLTKTSILKINQKLTIPVKAEPTTAPVAAAPPAGAPAADAAVPAVTGPAYVVKSGDSLWKIAKAHNVSVTAIKQANNLTSDALKINQKLTIPAGTAPAVATTTAQAGIAPTTYAEWQPGAYVEGGQTVHVVDIGETPATIAKKHKVTVDQLLKANNISDPKRIMVGQKLMIPGAPQQATTTAPTPTPAVVTAPIVTTSN
ncbi:MAG: hypothetical protein PCFJNLEI_01047 [Verrucomicrobiae bacterium]|nr:hypothetical protein [Verrucomicrobiae bacterium]